mmetsp:Transcript_16207/g.37288  ORF Transcript_16207/g.37288 Transcript_16207/m.37288 type:complete len:233 (-) Transcript_16207:1460-2158(-)
MRTKRMEKIRQRARQTKRKTRRRRTKKTKTKRPRLRRTRTRRRTRKRRKRRKTRHRTKTKTKRAKLRRRMQRKARKSARGERRMAVMTAMVPLSLTALMQVDERIRGEAKTAKRNVARADPDREIDGGEAGVGAPADVREVALAGTRDSDGADRGMAGVGLGTITTAGEVDRDTGAGADLAPGIAAARRPEGGADPGGDHGVAHVATTGGIGKAAARGLPKVTIHTSMTSVQ